jgi:hypothetical protein
MAELVGVDFVLQTIGFDAAVERVANMEAGLTSSIISAISHSKTSATWPPSSASSPKLRGALFLGNGAPRNLPASCTWCRIATKLVSSPFMRTLTWMPCMMQ